MNRPSTTRAAQMTAILAAILGGCSATGGEPTTEPQEGVNRPADGGDSPADVVDADTGGDPEAFADDPGAVPPGVLAFGETFTYDDGLQVTVSEPRPYDPSEAYLEFADGDTPHYVTFDMTLVNGTTAVHDPAGFYTTVQSGNAEASEVFDVVSGAYSPPQTPLLPDREAKWQVTYNVVDPADVVMQVRPGGIGYEPVLYAPGAAE